MVEVRMTSFFGDVFGCRSTDTLVLRAVLAGLFEAGNVLLQEAEGDAFATMFRRDTDGVYADGRSGGVVFAHRFVRQGGRRSQSRTDITDQNAFVAGDVVCTQEKVWGLGLTVAMTRKKQLEQKLYL